MASQVRSGEEPVVRKLALEAQAPLLCLRDLGDQLEVNVSARRGINVVLAGWEGEWIGIRGGGTTPTIRRSETRLASTHQACRGGAATVGAGVYSRGGPPRRRVGKAVGIKCFRQVIENTVGAAQGLFAASRHVPGKAHARFEEVKGI